MADPTWKDLVSLLATLQARVKNAPAPPGASVESTTQFTAKKTRIANLLAEMEKKAREECFSPDEQDNFVMSFLK